MKDLAASLRGQSFVLPKLDTLMTGWPSYFGKNYEKLQAIAETKYVKYSYLHSNLLTRLLTMNKTGAYRRQAQAPS